MIVILTATGTGSETTNVTVIIDAVNGHRQVLVHASLMSDVATLDAALAEDTSPHITAMAGIDTLTHIIEAYSVLSVTPFTDSLAIGAIAIIGKSLPEVMGHGHDLAMCGNMLLASYMAGMVFSSAGLRLYHMMVHQPGTALHIPHGLVNAMLLPTVMEFNRVICRNRFSQVGRALRTKKSDGHDAVNAVSEPIAEVEINKWLADAGVTTGHYGVWAQAVQEDIRLRSNPRIASLEQVVGLYAAAQQVPDATLTAFYPVYGIAHIGWIRRSRRIHQWRDAIAGCNVCRVLSGLRDCTCRADKAFTSHPPVTRCNRRVRRLSRFIWPAGSHIWGG